MQLYKSKGIDNAKLYSTIKTKARLKKSSLQEYCFAIKWSRNIISPRKYNISERYAQYSQFKKYKKNEPKYRDNKTAAILM